jgi:hypothetical protein
MDKYRLINISDILSSLKNILIQGVQENCHIAYEQAARINSVFVTGAQKFRRFYADEILDGNN